MSSRQNVNASAGRSSIVTLPYPMFWAAPRVCRAHRRQRRLRRSLSRAVDHAQQARLAREGLRYRDDRERVIEAVKVGVRPMPSHYAERVKRECITLQEHCTPRQRVQLDMFRGPCLASPLRIRRIQSQSRISGLTNTLVCTYKTNTI